MAATQDIPLNASAWTLLATGAVSVLVTFRSGRTADLHIGTVDPTGSSTGHTLKKDSAEAMFNGSLADGEKLWGRGSATLTVTAA